ncbi:hypothetical protein B0H10DRAFT_2212640 [Mycena sp. CBHHK59/15]|nr:hypothetical protein B0H10DRAFT_2212640 [Mycena sp. CBHHK59/15]
MQLAIISPTHALIIDKVEHNPLTIAGHPAWGALYNIKTHAVKPLSMQSNSFCAGEAPPLRPILAMSMDYSNTYAPALQIVVGG